MSRYLTREEFEEAIAEEIAAEEAAEKAKAIEAVDVGTFRDRLEEDVLPLLRVGTARLEEVLSCYDPDATDALLVICNGKAQLEKILQELDRNLNISANNIKESIVNEINGGTSTELKKLSVQSILLKLAQDRFEESKTLVEVKIENIHSEIEKSKEIMEQWRDKKIWKTKEAKDNEQLQQQKDVFFECVTILDWEILSLKESIEFMPVIFRTDGEFKKAKKALSLSERMTERAKEDINKIKSNITEAATFTDLYQVQQAISDAADGLIKYYSLIIGIITQEIQKSIPNQDTASKLPNESENGSAG